MAEPSWIGRTLSDRYEIQELLGQGGMSAVYKANDPNLRRVVAIKMIHSHLSQDPEFVRRFEEEAASVAKLRHPNLIQVYDFNHDGDTYFIVFEFVPGESLQDRLKRTKKANRQMDVAEVTDIAAHCADGLQYAHTKGLIHRDIKPANIMLNVMGDPIIMDFGIAKIMGGTQHTATGAVLGTARYMSPEQIKGERIDPRTDIYSLGITIFEMLGGRPPFEADSAMTLMMMHMTDPVPNLRALRSDVPPGLVTVVNKALAKNEGDRYQTAGDLAAALRGYADGDTAVPPATIYESSTHPAEDLEETVVEPLMTGESPHTGVKTGAAMAAGATAEAAARTGTPPPVNTSPSTADTGATTAPPQAGGGSRTLLYAAGGVLLLILIAVGIWAAFFRNSDGNGDLAAGGGAETPAVVTPSPTADNEATIEAGIAAELRTRDANAALTAEAQPTGTSEPQATATEQPEEPTEVPPPGSLAAINQVEGTVVVVGPGGEEAPFTPETPIVEGIEIATGEDGQLTLTLEDGSVVQIIENTVFSLDAISSNEEAAVQQIPFTLAEGDLLLRQPQPGHELAVYGPAGNLIGTLLNATTTSAAPKRAVAAKRAAQAEGEEAALSVHLEGDARVVISCFTGVCYSGNGSLVRPGWETIVARDDGAFISSFPITSSSASYRRWQEACDNCLESAPNPVQPTATTPPTEEAPPTWTPTTEATWTLSPPTDTPEPIYTATPTPPTRPTATPTEAAPAYNSRITGIRLDNGTYIVGYETGGFTEQLPGQHVHFYFDTVTEANAGVPGSGPWKLYGGPRPFTQYTEADRGAATAMCIRVANPDHSIIPGSGNCYPLP